MKLLWADSIQSLAKSGEGGASKGCYFIGQLQKGLLYVSIIGCRHFEEV